MKKWKMLAVFAYFVPLILFVLTKLSTRWGNDIENCIFALFVGLLVQCLIGVLGLIGIRKKVNMHIERVLFLISVFPLLFIIALFFVNRSYY
jgi:hypothetical protein